MNFLGKKSTWLQILFWGGIWILIPFIFSLAEGNSGRYLSSRSIVVFVGIAIMIFLNSELLLPRLYFKKKTIYYILASLILIITLVLLIYWEDAPWKDFVYDSQREGRRGNSRRRNPSQMMRFFFHSMPFFISLLGSALFEIATFANRKEKETVQLQKEKVETEMKFLKSQINPHFLFNSLNNIYTLTLIKSDAAPENLLKLSNMLRYMLYDCNETKVALLKEIQYIQNFIDLNLLKDSRGLNVKVDLDESRPDLMIAPLLFIPFIENAFKHSKIEDLENGWIDIKLKIKDQTILFDVKNSIPHSDYTKDTVGGIGLKNIKRQLQLLYPDKHQLAIEVMDKSFEVALKIDLG